MFRLRDVAHRTSKKEMRTIFVNDQQVKTNGYGLASCNRLPDMSESCINTRDLIDMLQNKCNERAQALVSAEFEKAEIDRSYVSGEWDAIHQLIGELTPYL